MTGARDLQSRQLTKISRLRIERGLTQKELAERSGVGLATFRRIERGEIFDPGIRKLSVIASALDCDLAEVVEEQWSTLDQAL